MPQVSGAGSSKRVGRPRGVSREQATYILSRVLASTNPSIADLRQGYDLGTADTLERNVDGLVGEGWLQRSRPSCHETRACSRVSLGPMAGDVVGIGVGREVLRCGLYRPCGDPHVQVRVESGMFPRPAILAEDAETTGGEDGRQRQPISPREFAQLVGIALNDCRQQLIEPIHPVGCVVAWPARISSETGEPRPIAYPRGWEGISLRKLILDALLNSNFPSMDVSIVNDADAEAVAESRVGVAQGARVALVIKVAGGVGAGIVHDGKPYVGAHGFAGELGHVPVALNDSDEQRAPTPSGVRPIDRDAVCSCGLRGHVEGLVSISALVERLRPGVAGDTGLYLPAVRILEREVSQSDLAQVMLQTGIILGRVLKGPVALLERLSESS
jgi:predicted NBD/HSP70 family sugar kinase